MAQRLQGDGTYLFAVSVGSRRDEQELAGIASDSDGQYTFSIDKYSNMSDMKRIMENRICADGRWMLLSHFKFRLLSDLDLLRLYM